jgi:hypothetical protein
MGKGRTTDIADSNVGGFVRFGAWLLGRFAQFLGGKPAGASLLSPLGIDVACLDRRPLRTDLTLADRAGPGNAVDSQDVKRY